MYHTGEKPGAGTYYCDECYHEITIAGDQDVLPVCPICSATTFYKASEQ